MRNNFAADAGLIFALAGLPPEVANAVCYHPQLLNSLEAAYITLLPMLVKLSSEKCLSAFVGVVASRSSPVAPLQGVITCNSCTPAKAVTIAQSLYVKAGKY